MTKSTIKLLPHILVRLGGMSFDVLEGLEFSGNVLERFEKLKNLEVELSSCKEDLLIQLQKYSVDFIHFKLVRKLKKVIRKEHLVTIDLFKVLDESIIDKVLIFNGLLENIYLIKDALKLNFNVEYLVIQQRLQAISKDENLQNALPISSLIFAKQYLKYLEKKPENFRKKELQTQQTLFQYLSRTAAKTSPFSSFTPVCYGQLTELEAEKCFDTDAVDLVLNRHLEWNNYLLELFKTAFLGHAEIFPYLKVELNSTLKSDELNYTFLINQRNIETFQTLEKQPILEIIEGILFSKNDLLIKDLVEILELEIEVANQELIAFIEGLVEIGFLEIQFSFHQQSSVWLDELIVFSANILILNKIGKPVFDAMKQQIKNFETANLSNRIEILEDSFLIIERFLNDLMNDDNQLDLRSVISPEQLIYEDTAYKGVVKLNHSKTEILIYQLNELLKNLNFIKGKERLEIAYFFDLHYTKNTVIPVLDFYEDYYKNGKNKLENKTIESVEIEAKLINKWVKAVEKLLLKKYEEDGKIELKSTDFKTINEQLQVYLISIKDNSFCCFSQLFESNEMLKGVLNGVNIGFGKMTGRFLDLMPNDFYNDLRHFNQDKNTAFIKIENADAAFFNANNHQLLLDSELLNTNNYAQNSVKHQIKITDLLIKKVDGELVIWHEKLNKQVRVYDLGIQTPKGRSPLYQLLLNFSPIVPTLHYLEMAIERFIKKINLENGFSPTIFYENWIIRRSRWKIPNTGKLKSNRHISEVETFQNWQNWQLENKLINKNFYIKNVYDFNNQELKNQKPTYINFNNLMSLNKHFYKTKNESEVLQIEVMNPEITKLLEISNQRYVSEFILQWYNE